MSEHNHQKNKSKSSDHTDEILIKRVSFGNRSKTHSSSITPSSGPTGTLSQIGPRSVNPCLSGTNTVNSHGGSTNSGMVTPYLSQTNTVKSSGIDHDYNPFSSGTSGLSGSTDPNSKKCTTGNQGTSGISGTADSSFKKSIIHDLPTFKSFGLDISNLHSDLDMDIEIPPVITAVYQDDFNILEVHEIILRKLIREKTHKLYDLRKKRDLELLKTKNPQTVVERKSSLAIITQLEKEIDKLTTDFYINSYHQRVHTLISTYRDLGMIPKVVSFKSTKNIPSFPEESQTNKNLRHLVISKYLEIARDYIQINVIREFPAETKCKGCDSSINNIIIDESGLQYCPVCRIETEIIAQTPFYRDTNRVNTSLRNNYEDRDNFSKAIKRYQGKQPNRLPHSLPSILDDYFTSYGLPTGEEVKKLPLDSRGRRGKTNKEMMYKALYDTGYASYYEDVNLICHLYWGWSLPDISHLEDAIIEDYDRSQRVYEFIKKDRKSCLNTQYRLFRHLQLRGYDCHLDDFKIVKTREILEYHEDTWKKICEHLNWTFIEII